MTSLSSVQRRLETAESLSHLAVHPVLLGVLTGETNTTSAGYPFICESSFNAFTEHVPHLFTDGTAVLGWVDEAERLVAAMTDLPEDVSQSLARAIKVLRNMVFTAGVTAPSDLWLLRQLLGVHHQIGFADVLLSGEPFAVSAVAGDLSLSEHQLQIDCDFLHARGFLDQTEGGFSLSQDLAMRDSVENLRPLPEAYRTHLVQSLREALEGGTASAFDDFFTFEAPFFSPAKAWFPNRFQIELGFRLLPLVLAMRALQWTANLKRGNVLADACPALSPAMHGLFKKAGMLRDGKLTALGARVFQRGPGPFGIVGAYYPYMNTLDTILRGEESGHWVSRGENVAASQDANAKTFRAANDALDDFLAHQDFAMDVFIEHAVGKGEATRQRFERMGEDAIRYFGADLEDAAIDEAVKQQQQGELPANMQFIRNADIGVPAKVVDAVRAAGCDTSRAVMMVGNGFHEIRNQTNEKMLEVFRGYAEAGILLIFTEETALSDRDLLNTAWNTYHAGFRYVHEMSGQGLRPSWEAEQAHRVWSWRKCARKAGYRVLDRYTTQTRTIYPTREPGRKNPSISVTYFCIPEQLSQQLGL